MLRPKVSRMNLLSAIVTTEVLHAHYRVSDRGPVNNLVKLGSVWREVSHFCELTPSRGEVGRWFPACTCPSRLFTLTSSMENACQPRKFLCRNVIANLNMAKQLAHECHRNTTNWSTFSHVVGASGSALFKGGPPKKAQHHGWKRPIKSHHTTPTHIDKLVVPCRKLDRGTPHQVISGTIGLRC